MTLDHVESAGLTDELAKILNSTSGGKAQIKEWKRLFAIDDVKGWKDTVTATFLRAQPYLVLDTANMSESFGARLVSAINDLDGQSSGLLVHSENFQGLTLLLERYREQIECVHIDPPYNTQTSGFDYKNSFQHSSWLAMMADRLDLTQKLLTQDGNLLCHIDENEYERLHALCNALQLGDAGTIIWDKRNPMLGRKGVATQHEYVLWRSQVDGPVYLRNANQRLMLDAARQIIKKHKGVTSGTQEEFAKWVADCSVLSGGERQYRFVSPDGRIYRGVAMGAPEKRTDPKFFVPLIHPRTKKACPVPPNGWSRTPETLKELMERGEILFGKDESVQPQKKVFLTEESQRQVASVISDASRGKADMDSLGLEFPYCHPVALYIELVGAGAPSADSVLIDFFAGSGTNGHAVIALNRDEGTRRKFVLAEMGDHFDTVLMPRIKKVVYSKDWKDGKPVSREGSSHIFKYFRMESYEDALNGIAFTHEKEGQSALKFMEDEYRLGYWLDFETQGSDTLLNVEKLAAPFEYTLEVFADGEKQVKKVDLPETFNYLIGLVVDRRRPLELNGRQYLLYTGTLRAGGAKTAVLWRDIRGWKPEDFDKERKALTKESVVSGFATIYVNGDSAIENAQSLDPVFKARMFAPLT